MKTRLLILILLVISITIPVTSFAEHPVQTEKPQDNFHKGTIEWVIHCNIGRVYSSTVRVIDYDMNQDPEKIEQFNIEVWSDYEDIILDYPVTETGNNTGIFDSTIFYKTTDESSGGRIRAVPESIVFVKYVDYTLPNGDREKDIIDTFVKSELSASGWRDDGMWKITYDPCMIEYLDKNKNSLDWFNIFYPAPLKQIESGLNNDEIQCKESLTFVTKHDGSPACVKPETELKLIERGWIEESLLHFRQSNGENFGGTWLSEPNECENISYMQCSQMSALYSEESTCRHDDADDCLGWGVSVCSENTSNDEEYLEEIIENEN